MFFHKFFQKLFLSPSKKIKTMPPKERQVFLYKQIYKYVIAKKVLMNKLYLLNLSKEKKVPLNMFEDNLNEENIKLELLSLLNEGYEALSNIYLGENQQKAISELTNEEAINVIQWIDRFFIEGFERLEEYEKCSLLKEFAEKIKEVKQLN